MPTRACTCAASSELSSARASVSTEPARGLGADHGEPRGRQLRDGVRVAGPLGDRVAARRSRRLPVSGRRPPSERRLLQLQQQQPERTAVAHPTGPTPGPAGSRTRRRSSRGCRCRPRRCARAAGGRAPTATTVRSAIRPSAASAAHTAEGTFSIKSRTGATPALAALGSGLRVRRAGRRSPTASPRARRLPAPAACRARAGQQWRPRDGPGPAAPPGRAGLAGVVSPPGGEGCVAVPPPPELPEPLWRSRLVAGCRCLEGTLADLGGFTFTCAPCGPAPTVSPPLAPASDAERGALLGVDLARRCPIWPMSYAETPPEGGDGLRMGGTARSPARSAQRLQRLCESSCS